MADRNVRLARPGRPPGRWPAAQAVAVNFGAGFLWLVPLLPLPAAILGGYLWRARRASLEAALAIVCAVAAADTGATVGLLSAIAIFSAIAPNATPPAEHMGVLLVFLLPVDSALAAGGTALGLLLAARRERPGRGRRPRSRPRGPSPT